MTVCSRPFHLALGLLALLVVGLIPVRPGSAQSSADSLGALNWYALPSLYYTPETSLGGGAAGGYFFASDDGRPSSVQGDLSVTLKGQYALNLQAERYRAAARQRLFADLAISEYPDQFYGIGPATTEAMAEDVTTRFADAVVQAERRVTPGLRFGMRGRVRHEVVTAVEEGGVLDQGRVPGHEGGMVVGLGVVAVRDTRSRAFYPQRGTYATAYGVVHAGALGSTFDFTRVVIDARQYRTVGPDHVIALQAYGEAVAGTAPFSLLPQLGGPLRMRGYLEGRFRDNVYATVQGEWRFPLRGRFAGTLFVGTGAVAPRLDRFGAEGLEVSGGAGLRYRLNDTGVHIRLDVAMGREAGLYITAQQPF